MSIQDIRQRLFALQDHAYRDFQVKLIPSINPEKMIGVRTPELRKLARELAKEKDGDELAGFLQELPMLL